MIDKIGFVKADMFRGDLAVPFKKILVKAILGKSYHLERAKDGMEAVTMFEELHPDAQCQVTFAGR